MDSFPPSSIPSLPLPLPHLSPSLFPHLSPSLFPPPLSLPLRKFPPPLSLPLPPTSLPPSSPHLSPSHFLSPISLPPSPSHPSLSLLLPLTPLPPSSPPPSLLPSPSLLPPSSLPSNLQKVGAYGFNIQCVLNAAATLIFPLTHCIIHRLRLLLKCMSLITDTLHLAGA